jgi:hypothetical protein
MARIIFLLTEEKIFLEINQSETRIACGALGREYPWKVLYKDCSFHPDSLTDMAATGNSCF